MDALVTDVNVRTGVAGLRALGRAGIRTIAAGPSRFAAGLWSRYAAGRELVADSTADPDGFVDCIRSLAVDHGKPVVYAGLEESLDALLQAWPTLSPDVQLPYPSAEVVSKLRDKRALPALVDGLGIPVPTTVFEGRAEELDIEDTPVPCTLKAAMPEQGLGLAHVAESRGELRSIVSRIDPKTAVILQERLVGPRLGLVVVVDRDGRLVARFQHRAKRLWPPGAGASAVTVSVAPDERLAIVAARMLSEAGYFGLADLDLIETPNGAALIDVNPRLFACLPLPLAAGINLPAAWHAVVTGGDLPSPAPYRLGVSYHWLEADLLAAKRGLPRRLLDPPPRPRVGAGWAADDAVASVLLAGRSTLDRVSGRLSRSRRTGSAHV